MWSICSCTWLAVWINTMWCMSDNNSGTLVENKPPWKYAVFGNQVFMPVAASYKNNSISTKESLIREKKSDRNIFQCHIVQSIWINPCYTHLSVNSKSIVTQLWWHTIDFTKYRKNILRTMLHLLGFEEFKIQFNFYCWNACKVNSRKVNSYKVNSSTGTSVTETHI